METTDEQSEGETEAPIDYRTATTEEVATEHSRIRSGRPATRGQGDYGDVDWQGLSREDFRLELAKRGIHIRRSH